MLSSSTEDEKLLSEYIKRFTAAFRAAPASLSKAMGGPSGIFLMIDANPVADPNSPVPMDGSRGSKKNSPGRDSPKMRTHSHSHDGDFGSPHGGSSIGGKECLFFYLSARFFKQCTYNSTVSYFFLICRAR
jgi:hypothetical protein